MIAADRTPRSGADHIEQIPETIPSWEATGRSIIAIAYLLGAMFVFSLAQASGRVGFLWATTAFVLTPVIALVLLAVVVGIRRQEEPFVVWGNSTDSYRHRILRQC